MIGPSSFLRYEGYRWLKLSLLALVLSIAFYAVYNAMAAPQGGPSGNTFAGYTLGGIAAALILWLMWFGMRKRSYASTGAPLSGWLSAHVYVGALLLVLVPLHSGFQFGWNVHTLAYVLMSLVIVSGFFGVYFYATVPAPMTRNRPGKKLDELLERIAEADTDCLAAAVDLPDSYARPVREALDSTRLGGGMWSRIFGEGPEQPTRRAVAEIEKLEQGGTAVPEEQRACLTRVLELLALRTALLQRTGRDLRFQALLDLWLILHVPLAFATVAAVAVHIFVVFYYW